MNLPVDFESKARAAKSASGGGYPVQISAADLMRNFVFAALGADDSLIESTTAQGGHTARKLKIPAVPTEGKKMLKAESGALTWAENAIPDGTVNNELLRWDGTKWEPFGRGATDGQLLVAKSGGWVPFSAPPTSGTHVLGSVSGELQWISTEEC